MFRDADFEISDEEWLETWDITQQVNLRSAALLCKWAINAWTEKESKGESSIFRVEQVCVAILRNMRHILPAKQV